VREGESGERPARDPERRPEDVLPLAEAFLTRLAARGRARLRLTPAAEAALQGYAWPGNVRELENALERAMALCREAAGAVAPRGGCDPAQVDARPNVERGLRGGGPLVQRQPERGGPPPRHRPQDAREAAPGGQAGDETEGE
jgi:DNA-binding NtrC family response regulator